MQVYDYQLFATMLHLLVLIFTDYTSHKTKPLRKNAS